MDVDANHNTICVLPMLTPQPLESRGRRVSKTASRRRPPVAYGRDGNATAEDSLSRKRARDRKAQTTLREKRNAYIANLEARVAFYESNRDSQLVRLTNCLADLYAENEELRNQQSRTIALMREVEGSKAMARPIPLMEKLIIAKEAREADYLKSLAVQLKAPPASTDIGTTVSDAPDVTTNNHNLPTTLIGPKLDAANASEPSRQANSKLLEGFITLAADVSTSDLSPPSTREHAYTGLSDARNDMRGMFECAEPGPEEAELDITVSTPSILGQPDHGVAILQAEQSADDLSYLDFYDLRAPLAASRNPTDQNLIMCNAAVFYGPNSCDSPRMASYVNTQETENGRKLHKLPTFSLLGTRIQLSEPWTKVPICDSNPYAAFDPVQGYLSHFDVSSLSAMCSDVPEPIDLLYGSATNVLANAISLQMKPFDGREADKLGLAYLIYVYTMWRMFPSQERYQRVPDFFRPVEDQLKNSHPPAFDQLLWPQLRCNFIKLGVRMSLAKLTQIFRVISKCLRVRWGNAPVLERDSNGTIKMSHDFYATITRKDGWVIKSDFVQQYPHLAIGLEASQICFEV